MTTPVPHSGLEKSQVTEFILRMAGGGLTVGFLIILPALKILGVI